MFSCRANAKRDGTSAETRIGLSAKRTSPIQSAGGSVQSTTGSRRVWSVDARRLATHSIRIFPLHFPSRASPCAITSRVSYRTQFHQQPRKAAHQEHKSQLTKTTPFNERQAAKRRLLNLSTAMLNMKAECSVKSHGQDQAV